MLPLRTLPAVVVIVLGVMGCGAATNFHCKLAGNYYLWCSSSIDILVAPRIRDDHTLIIPSTVREVAWDERFILAKQVPRMSSVGVTNYWIMDVVGKKLLGPLDAQGFVTETKQCGVPLKLQLRPVGVFRSTENHPIKSSSEIE